MPNKEISVENKFDVIIIGGGPGGYVGGEHAGKNGLKTLVIEKENLGGVCLNKGCIPTKTLLKSAKIFHYIKEANKYGIDIEGDFEFKLNWKQIQTRKDNVVQQLIEGIKFLLKSAKATYIEGEAKLISDHVVAVNGELYHGEKIILATGSTPRYLNLPGFDVAQQKGFVVDSTQALELKEIPKKFTVIGGGVIGVEFALLYNELGSDVTIIQGLDRILEVIDHDLSKTMTDILIKKGIKIITNANVKEIKNKTLHFEVNAKLEKIEIDKLLVSIGRIPDFGSFAEIDLVYNVKKQIVVNKHLQTSKRHIYAIGDVTQQIMLAHVAYKHAVMAVDHILGLNTPYHLIETPWCIYTFPEVAGIGLSEYEIDNKNFVISKMPMTHLGKALADAETDGFIKMIFEKTTGKILGCHMIASTASDLISEISLAMQAEATVFDLAATIHPHPSISEVFYEIAKKAIYDHFSK